MTNLLERKRDKLMNINLAIEEIKIVGDERGLESVVTLRDVLMILTALAIPNKLFPVGQQEPADGH